MVQHLWQLCLVLVAIIATSGSVAGRAHESVPATLQLTPPAPVEDIPYAAEWAQKFESGQPFSVADVQTLFNHARQAENSQLSLSLPMLQLPSQREWDELSYGEKALWLINRERIDRGVLPLHGVEANVTSVAQAYAEFLLPSSQIGHDLDGLGPLERLKRNAVLGRCSSDLDRAELLGLENITAIRQDSPIQMPVELAVYHWIYWDGECCSWFHRLVALQDLFVDNSGPNGQEGFLGIGHASGTVTEQGQTWHKDIIVMNVFDPCPEWNYADQNHPSRYSLHLPMLMR